MDLRTELVPAPSNKKIGLGDRIFTIGSCFSQTIGHYLQDHKFKVEVNTFGTVYNPTSILNLLNLSIDHQYPDKAGLVKNGEIFNHYDFHSDQSALTESELFEKVNNSIDQANATLSEAKWIIITFGSAITYKLKEGDRIVANCHKVPQSNFNKGILSVDEIVKGFEEFSAKLNSFNSQAEIILTVSPVRHTREGLEANAYSKSVLRVACEQLTNQNDHVQYFPSYELMLDDLRDYRFYSRDLVHPTEIAEDYIWERFIAAYINDSDQKVLNDWQRIKRALDHRPRHTATNEYRKFLEKTLADLKRLSGTLDLNQEITKVTTLLNDHSQNT